MYQGPTHTRGLGGIPGRVEDDIPPPGIFRAVDREISSETAYINRRGYAATLRSGITEISLGCRTISIHPCEDGTVEVFDALAGNWMALTNEATVTFANVLIVAAQRAGELKRVADLNKMGQAGGAA